MRRTIKLKMENVIYANDLTIYFLKDKIVYRGKTSSKGKRRGAPTYSVRSVYEDTIKKIGKQIPHTSKTIAMALKPFGIKCRGYIREKKKKN